MSRVHLLFGVGSWLVVAAAAAVAVAAAGLSLVAGFLGFVLGLELFNFDFTVLETPGSVTHILVAPPHVVAM